MQAQNPGHKFDYLTIYDGLSQSFPTSIAQDELGFIWIGTRNGLNRYDGRQIKNFFSNSNIPLSLINNDIKVVYADKNGRLWIGTKNGLNLYNFEKEDFFNFVEHGNKNAGISNYEINSIIEDSNNSIWVLTSNGLYHFHPNDSSFKNYRIKNSANQHNCAIEVSNNEFWIGTNDGLYSFNRAFGVFEEVKVPELKNLKILEIEQINEFFLFATDKGLFVFDPRNKTYVKTKGTAIGHGEKINSLYRGKSGKCWICTDAGLFDIDDNLVIRSFDLGVHSENSLMNPYVHSIFEDKGGVVWVGTYNGINKFDPKRTKFRHYKTGERQKSIKPNDYLRPDDLIWAIHADQDKTIWIGTKNNGLYRYGANYLGTSNYKAYMHSEKNKNSLSGNSVYAIKQHNDETLLLGTNEGLAVFNTRGNLFYNIIPEFEGLGTGNEKFIFAICKDKSGLYWLGTMDGLFRFDIQTKKVIGFKHNPEVGFSLSNNTIYGLNCDKNGIIWVATQNGLNCFIPETVDTNNPGKTIFKRFKAIPGKHNALSDNMVMNVFEDSKGRIWVSTNNGLTQLNKKDSSFLAYSVKDGLPGNMVYNIIEDNNHFLWISTNRGLTKFDPEKSTFINYDVKNGLQSNEFNNGAAFKDNNGNIYFGGINGFNVFHPDSLASKSEPPPIVLTKFSVFQEELTASDRPLENAILKQSISLTKEIVLKYNENFFEITFAALDYSKPDQNQYAFFLENFDDTWTYSGTKNYARYTNVPPGDYIFRVKASNSDYIWNQEGISIRIKIKPPFWKTKWFISATVLLVILSIFFLIKVRELQWKETQKRLAHEVRARTREIEQAKEELKRNAEFIEAVVNNAIDAILVIKKEGDTVMWNPAFEQMIGYTSTELTDIKFQELLSGKWEDFLNKYILKISQGQKGYFEFECMHKNGQPLTVAAAMTKMKMDSGSDNFLSIMRDITKKKEYEKELEEYRIGLEKLVDQRTTELLKAKEEAEIAEKLKSAFLKNLSHEIRTPMNAIVGFSQLLEDSENADQEVIKFTKLISHNAYQLLDLLDNIITLSKYESESFSIILKKVSLNSLMELLYAKYLKYLQTFEKEEIDLIVKIEPDSGLPDIFTDEAKIKQVLIILLDNAFKFTEKGVVEFGLMLFAEKQELVFYVKDTGIGIHQNKLDGLFKNFSKIEGERHEKLYRGVGLGLAMAKHIVGKLDGKIWAVSEIDKGSTFFFKIPYYNSKDK
jgi:PAS domain S-box-containing protein